MALEKIVKVEGSVVHVPGDDVDTDRIIPARFMKCVTFDGLGEFLFYDVRFGPDGKPQGHPLDRPERKGATILLVGRNFGCGSSREHAPQALRKFGIRAIVGAGFAEIFFGNCTTLGLPCVSLEPGALAALAGALDADSKLRVCIDLNKKEVRYGRGKSPFNMKEGARLALVKGEWDAIGQLLEGKEEAARLERSLPYLR